MEQLKALNRIPSQRILVVGDLMLDVYRVARATRISPEAPVPVLLNPMTECRLGGAGAVAAMCAALGAQTAVLGVTGQNRSGEQIYEILTGLGVTCLAVVDSTRPTTTKERICGVASGRHRQQLARMDTESTVPLDADLSSRLAGIIAEAAQNILFDAIIIADYAKGVCTDRIIQACRDTGVPVFVDPPKGVDWPKYYGVECVVPNREEAAGKSARDLCRQLQSQAAVVKLDQDGCELACRSWQVKTFPARTRAVHDVTGAGDQFIAVLACARAVGLDWPTATQLANAAAGLQVERHGCIPVQIQATTQEFDDASRVEATATDSVVECVAS
ncbi:MAG: PfkB family carbohydrate kinase [Planctomycetota bacterium]